ncbi:MAG: hypothetical protein MP439_02680 [Ferrimicrobium sp.]|jgi:folate-binding protein YgfZ|nr:hypothetical protein [Ferrimicrobium sp.]
MQPHDHQRIDSDNERMIAQAESPIRDQDIVQGSRVVVPLASLIVSGADTIKFLQGQLTNDLNQVDVHNPLIAAICTPEGKLVTIVRFEILDPERVRLITYREHLTALLERLTRFKLRVKISFEVEEQAWAVIDDDSTSPLWPLDAPLITTLELSATQNLPSSESFTQRRLAHVAIHLPTDAPGELLVASVPTLVARGVSFTKGCYVGQELVARTDSRGAKPPISLFVARFRTKDASPWATLSTPAQLTTDSGAEAGEIRALLVQEGAVVLGGWVKRRWYETTGLRAGSLTLPAPLLT